MRTIEHNWSVIIDCTFEIHPVTIYAFFERVDLRKEEITTITEDNIVCESTTVIR